jgi:AmmeMemoRadiSam system protein B
LESSADSVKYLPFTNITHTHKNTGATAGYSYKHLLAWLSLPSTAPRRIFILGPSHHHHTRRCELPAARVTAYDTPVGQLRLDAATLGELRATGLFNASALSRHSALLGLRAAG